MLVDIRCGVICTHDEIIDPFDSIMLRSEATQEDDVFIIRTYEDGGIIEGQTQRIDSDSDMLRAMHMIGDEWE